MNETMTKVLVADDEENNLSLFERMLQTENFTVIKAHDGVEALDKFDKCRPDVVLVDLMMPRLNGYEVCARLKHNPRAKHVPIILLTAMDEPETRSLALNSGANDFLTKPVATDVLLAHIQAQLKLARAMRPAT